MRATEAIAPLLGLLRRVDDDHDDWVSTDLPHVFAAMGAASIPPVAAYLADSGHGEYARVAAAQALVRIGEAHADLRAECVPRLSQQLANFVAESPSMNGFLLSALLDLRAVEAAPVMEQTFASRNIDTTIAGDWEEVQVELGLKTRREHPPLPNRYTEMSRQLREVFNMPEPDVDRFDTDASVIASTPALPVRAASKVSRNDPCPCGSRKKFKKCCGG